MPCRFMYIFSSFRIDKYPSLSVFVSEKQTSLQFLWNVELSMKCCMWEFQDWKFDKATFVPEISYRVWCQEDNASSLILSVSCNAAVFNLIYCHSKFTSLTLSLLLVRESIVYIAPWLIAIVFGLKSSDMQLKSHMFNSRTLSIVHSSCIS